MKYWNKFTILNAPLKYYFFYMLVTLLISFWGPAVYKDYDKWSVLIFISFFFICISLGFFYGLSRRVYPVNPLKKKKDIMPLLKFSILVSFILIFFEFIYLLITKPSLFSLSSIGGNYLLFREELDTTGSYNIFQLMRFLTGFLKSVAMIIGFYKFTSLSPKYKLFFIGFLLLSIIVFSIGYGTQKIFGDILFYFLIVLSVKLMWLNKDQRKKVKSSILLVFAIFSIYFVINQIQRFDSIGIDVSNFSSNSDGMMSYDTDHFIFKIFGNKIGFGIAILLTSYLSSGYYGLSLCLQLPFVWTQGFGSSYPLSVFVNRFFGFPNFYLDTYLHRMDLEFGRSGLRAWNSIFPWLASDLTFVGSILIFIPVGIIYAISWKEVVKYRNPVSLLMFATLTLGLIYVPNNNQLFNGVDAFIGTITIIIFWFLKHKKYNIALSE